MPRENTPHSRESLMLLASKFHEAGDAIEEQASRFAKEKIKEKPRVAHQVAMEKGLFAAKWFVQELGQKLDRIVIEREAHEQNA